VVPAAGVVTAAAGAVVTVHGVAVGVNTMTNILSKKTKLSQQPKDYTVEGTLESQKGLDIKQKAAVDDARGSGIPQRAVDSKVKTKQNGKRADRNFKDQYNKGHRDPDQ
jgi:hypothetical protein